MSGLVDKDGKPTEKKWDDMDLDERLNVLRMGIGALIQQGNALGTAVSRIVKAMDESEAAGGLDNPTHIDEPIPSLDKVPQ